MQQPAAFALPVVVFFIIRCYNYIAVNPISGGWF